MGNKEISTFNNGSSRLAQAREKISSISGIYRYLNYIVFSQGGFILLASFLLGRAVLFSELAPFGLAFWAVLYREQRERCPKAALLLLLGTYSSRSLLGAASLLVGMFMVIFLERFFEGRRSAPFPLPVLAAVGLVVARFPYLAINSFIPYDVFLTFLEVILIVPVVAFFLYGTALLWPQEESKAHRQEEIVGGLFFFAFLLLGLTEGPEWVIFLQEVIVKTAVLVLAYVYGGALGAATGLALGIFLRIGSGEYIYISLLSFAGLLAGVFRDMGKAGTVAGFLMGILLCSFYIGDGGDIFLYLPQGLAASLLFLLLPASVFGKLKEFAPAFSLLTGNGEVDEEVRRTTSRRLNDLSRTFQRIAGAFQNTSDRDGVQEENHRFLDRMGEEACRNCGSYQSCWQNGFPIPYSVIKNALEEGGVEKVTVRDLPFSIRQKCRYLSRLLKTINRTLERYRLEAVSRQHLQEGRAMVAGQLEGISSIINGLSHEIKLKTEVSEQDKKEYHAFTVEIGVSQVAKQGQEVSGDYYSLVTLKGGKQVIILSDGMGSGERAKEESRSTVVLLEDLLEAGFSRELIFKTVNSVMQLRSSDETFSTVDLAVLDLKEGSGELCKIGAAPSFIKRGSQVKELSGSSLPLGILREIEMDIKRERLEDGDLLVMVTDGISEAGVRVNNSANWIKRALLEIKHMHPQLVADHILEEALQKSKGTVSDDMSVIVCKLRRIRGQ